MSNTGNNFKHEALREVAAGSITNTYASLGGPLEHRAYIITMMNNTNGDIYVTVDTTQDEIKIPAQSGRVWDYKTDDGIKKVGTQFYIKYETTPGAPTGWFAIEVEYV